MKVNFTKTILLILGTTFWTSCFGGGVDTNSPTTLSTEKPEKLAPLRLTYPAPSLGGNGPINLPVGPHFEPFHDQPPALFLAPIGVSNIAFGKPVTASVDRPERGSFSMITDGKKEAFDYDLVEISKGVQWVQIDLERVYAIHAVVIWHDYYLRFPVTRGVIVQAADDAGFSKSVRTLFNNDYENLAGLGAGSDKQYAETHRGKLIDAKGILARYLRFYSNGNSNSPRNGYAEIEVWGLPVD